MTIHKMDQARQTMNPGNKIDQNNVYMSGTTLIFDVDRRLWC